MRATDLHRYLIDDHMRAVDWIALFVVLVILGGLIGAGLHGNP